MLKYYNLDKNISTLLLQQRLNEIEFRRKPPPRLTSIKRREHDWCVTMRMMLTISSPQNLMEFCP